MMDNDYSSSANGQTRVNPAVNQPSDNAYGGFIWADYIYWVPSVQSNTGVSGVYSGGSTSPVEGKAFYPNFNGLSGFRVGLGMNMDHDNWDLFADYTWLQKNSKSLHTNYDVTSGSTAVGAYMPTNRFVNQASNYWTYQFNNIDLDCGRDFFVGRYFALRPHAGFKFAWTKQTLFAEYVDTTSHEFEATNHQHFWGVGVRAGVDPTFYLSDNWQFFCTTAVAFPWSKFHIKQSVVDVTTPETPSTYNSFDQNYWTVAPVLETAFGLRWMTKFGDNNVYGFGLQVGWEEQVWFNQNNWVNVAANSTGVYNNSIANGALTQQGLTVRANFSF
jgi:hypothetical protein